MDSQNRAQDLAASILAATAPPQIAAACSAVDAFLRRHASDQSRAFFSVALPALICRLFGFDDVPPPPSSYSFSAPSAASSGRPASTAWIDQAAADPALAGRLFALLAPDGILISSISAVDRHALVRYVFPIERLPEWIRVVLQSDRPISVLSELCPLLKGRVKEDTAQGSPYQIQLNALEYYMFWFAYYPVSRGNSDSSDANVVRKSRKFRLENWTSSLPVLSSATRRSGQKPERNLYLQLLYAYLRAFVPKNRLASYQPYRSSLLHYSLSYDGTAFLQAEFLVYTLAHFWMIDNDFSPLPVNFCRSFCLTFPYRAVLGETPPIAGLGDALKLVAKYLNCNSTVSGRGNELMVYGESPKLKSSLDVVSSRNVMLYCENSVGSWNTVIQRPLYRFILRSFLFCPIGASLKNASQVFDLWMSYLEPWKTSPEDFSGFEMKISESGGKENNEKSSEGKERHQMDFQYSPAWESYVLSNYLFYSSLLVHFLGFAHKFLHTNVESVIQMVLKVLTTLASSKELLDLLQKVDVACHFNPARTSAYSSNDAYKYVPSICEQLQDWEDGLCESDADGSFLHENWNHDLKLFSDSEDGAHNLLQLFVLRAEHEIQISSGDVTSNMQALDTIRSQTNILFGGTFSKPQSPTTSQTHDLLHGRGEIFSPKHPGVGKRTWADVRYKGDWMRRPISDTEVAWLARLLIRFSDRLNESFGLDHVLDERYSTGPAIVELSPDEVCNVEGPKEALNMVLAFLSSWLTLFGNTVVRFMRAHQMRINLRVLASKKFVMLLLLYAVFYALKVFSAAFAIATPA